MNLFKEILLEHKKAQNIEKRYFERLCHFADLFCDDDKYGIAHGVFLMYCSVPTLLSTELLHNLWFNFKTLYYKNKPTTINPIVVNDIFISGVVRAVNADVYEIPSENRFFLQQLLKEHNEDLKAIHYFERDKPIIKEIASFIKYFVQQQQQSLSPKFIKALDLGADVILNPASTLYALAQEMANVKKATDILQLSILTDEILHNIDKKSYIDSLGTSVDSEKNLTLLVTYAQSLKQLMMTGPTAEVRATFDNLVKNNPERPFLPIPPVLLPVPKFSEPKSDEISELKEKVPEVIEKKVVFTKRVGPKVLIIEDEIDFYGHYFNGWDKVFVDIQADGLQDFAAIESRAIECKVREQPDLVILDLELLPGQLPDESMPLLRTLVNHANSVIPIIVVSKRYNPATRDRILDLGGIDLIDKNKLLSNLSLLEKIGSILIEPKHNKRKEPFIFLENRIIGITANEHNTGERIVENKKYAFYTKDSFKNLLRSLLLDPAICPAYYFPIKPKPDLSPAFIAYLTTRAESINRLPFSELKNLLRKGIKELYDQDVKRKFLVEAPDYTLPKEMDESASREAVLYKKLEDLMQESIKSKKLPEEIEGLRERFFAIYNENPNLLSDNHKYHFRIFLNEYP